MHMEGTSMGNSRKPVRWSSVIVGALMAEVALFPLTFGWGWATFHLSLPEWINFSGYGFLMFITLVGGGLWAARRADGRFILHGALAGLIAALLVLPLLLLYTPEHPVHEVINELLKVAGGAVGGVFATRRKTALQAVSV
jgi:putative membrane protein (TIGR04086 family)